MCNMSKIHRFTTIWSWLVDPDPAQAFFENKFSGNITQVYDKSKHHSFATSLSIYSIQFERPRLCDANTESVV